MAADPVMDAAIWERYEQDRPRPGRPLSLWVSRLSDESGIPEAQIRRVIARGAGTMLNAISDRIQTYAQDIADLIGADLVTALDTLRESFTATKKKVLLDKSGRPRLIDETEGGPGYVPENMIYIEVPDWHARLSAVRTAVEIHGARAPQQIEVNQKVVTLDLTPDAALAELERLALALPRLQAAIAAGEQGASGATGRRAAIEVSVGDQGHPLLADRMHPDEGRAGQDQSL